VLLWPRENSGGRGSGLVKGLKKNRRKKHMYAKREKQRIALFNSNLVHVSFLDDGGWELQKKDRTKGRGGEGKSGKKEDKG